jgi:hypothetical protein
MYCPTREAKQGHCTHRKNNTLNRKKKKVKRRPGEGRDEATEGELGRWPDLDGFWKGCSSSSPIGWRELWCTSRGEGRRGEGSLMSAQLALATVALAWRLSKMDNHLIIKLKDLMSAVSLNRVLF